MESLWRRASFVVCAAGAAGVSALAAVKAWKRLRQLMDDENSQDGGYTWEEIATHKTYTSVWIVINNEVYDVTPYLNEHPGGKILLLAYGGWDATEPFTTVGHSPMAIRLQKRYHIGRVNKSSGPRPIRPGEKQTVNSDRPATIIGGYLPSPSTPSSRSSSTPLWAVRDYGFLPFRDPCPVEALLDTVFKPYAQIAELLPTMAVSGALRRYINANKDLQEAMQKCTTAEIDKLSEDELERAFTVVAYIVNAYWRGGLHRYGNGLFRNMEVPLLTDGTAEPPIEKIPEFLGMPLLLLSKKLDRPPRLDYAATVLYNWERIDPDGPLVVSNIRCPLRLTGLSDEEWFFKTHVVIESEAAPAVSAVKQMMETEDDQALLQPLIALEEALWRTVRACMPLMYERVEHGIEHGVSKCNEHVFYQVLRPMISTGKIKFEGDWQEERFLHGPSGAMSSLMPAVDAALGINMTSVKLREALDMFEKSMPQGHRDFLAHLRGRDSIRSRILLSRPPGGQSDEHHEALVRSYNRCISRVLDFRWQHWQYVKNFIMKPGDLSFATGTGGTSFDYLQQHITDTEQARIAEHGAGFTTVGSPCAADDSRPNLPSLTGVAHSSAQLVDSEGSFWGVDGPNGLLAAEPMLGLEDWELWEKSMPQHLHGAVWELVDLAMRLPALCSSENCLYDRCEKVKDKLAPLRKDDNISNLSEANRERLLTLLTFVTAACRATTTRKDKVPKCIDWPFQVASRLAARPAQVDIIALMLANWTADGTKAPEGGSGMTSCTDIKSHLRPVLLFAPSQDEAWYRAVHLVLHYEAREVVAAVRAGQAASLELDDKAVVKSLEDIGSWMNKMCNYFDAHFDQKDSRTEAVSYRRLAKFVAQDFFDEEQTACWVYTHGSSVLLPMLHAILGLSCFNIDYKIDSPEVERLRGHLCAWSEEIKMFMPIPHRNFLEALQKPGVSMRQYCIKRFGADKAPSVEELHALEVAYNDALNGLVRFLSRRMHLVVRLQPELSSAFAILHGHLEASLRKHRLQLLKMRQRVLARLEPDRG